MKMESLQQRQQELENKEKQLKEAVLKFDKFLKVWRHWGRDQQMLPDAL